MIPSAEQLVRLSSRAPGLLVGEEVDLPPDAVIGAGVIIHRGTGLGIGLRVGDRALLGKPLVLGRRSSASHNPLPPLTLGDRAAVGAYAVLMEGARIGLRTAVEDGAHVRERAFIGDDVVVGAGASIDNDTFVGDRVEIHAGAYITAYSRVEDDVVIGANVTTTNDDTMGRRPPDHRMRGALLRRGCRVGGRSVILPGIEVGENARVAPGSVVTRDVASGGVVGGVPARYLGNVSGE